jgi:hypothetical protein
VRINKVLKSVLGLNRYVVIPFGWPMGQSLLDCA